MKNKDKKKEKDELDELDNVVVDNDDDIEHDHALLKILQEKDNLIVSLKEASTRRDKLNEKQIRLLSEDNAKKSSKMKAMQSDVRNFESFAKQKEAELSVFKVTEDKLTSKVEEFKTAFDQYKSSIRSSLNSIKISITEEFSKRDEYKEHLLDNMQASYQKLEAQVQEVENYYKEIIADITKKQSMSKKHIRQALNNLQEGLSYLDLSHIDISEPIHVKEEFRRIVDESSDDFKEFKELKGKFQGNTIIKNIENVNVELSEAPVIEGVFREIKEIRTASGGGGGKSTKVELASDKRKEETDAGEEGGSSGAPGASGGSSTVLNADKDTPITFKAGQVTGGVSGGAGGGPSSIGTVKAGRDAGGADAGSSSGGSAGGAGAGSSSGAGKETRSSGAFKSGGSEGAGGGDGGSRRAGEADPREEKKKDRPSQGLGGRKDQISDDRSEGEPDEEEPKKKKADNDFQEIVFKRGRNYAPFNWRAILSDIQLDRFQSIIESSIKAEKEGKLMKSLGLYRTIQEQPGISDTIAGGLLADHIEYLEDLIKRQYSIVYETEEGERVVQTV